MVLNDTLEINRLGAYEKVELYTPITPGEVEPTTMEDK